MALTVTQIEAAKPRKTAFRMSDGQSLYLTVRPSGTKSWQMRYKRGGAETMTTLGTYPELSLKDAREKSFETRAMIQRGEDPVVEKQKMRSAAVSSFGDCAEAWFGRETIDWAAGHSKRTRSILDRDILPLLGKRDPRDISPPEVLAILQRIEGRGAVPTAKKAKGIVSMIFGYAIASGLADNDPTLHIKRAMGKAPAVMHRPAITDPEELGVFLDDLWSWEGGSVAQQLLQIGIYTFQRPGEIRAMRWEDIDLDRGLWSYHVTKVKIDHAVPLAPSALKLIQNRLPLQKQSPLVFGNTSDAITGKLLAKLEYKNIVTAHGFRATARTLLAERLKMNPELIERQLSHVVTTAHGRAYNRTTFIEERIEMMQQWADYLDGLRSAARARRLGIAAVS